MTSPDEYVRASRIVFIIHLMTTPATMTRLNIKWAQSRDAVFLTIAFPSQETTDLLARGLATLNVSPVKSDAATTVVRFSVVSSVSDEGHEGHEGGVVVFESQDLDLYAPVDIGDPRGVCQQRTSLLGDSCVTLPKRVPASWPRLTRGLHAPHGHPAAVIANDWVRWRDESEDEGDADADAENEDVLAQEWAL